MLGKSSDRDCGLVGKSHRMRARSGLRMLILDRVCRRTLNTDRVAVKSKAVRSVARVVFRKRPDRMRSRAAYDRVIANVSQSVSGGAANSADESVAAMQQGRGGQCRRLDAAEHSRARA